MRTSEPRVVWALIAGCCAGHPVEPSPAVEPTPPPVVEVAEPAAAEVFVAIDVEEAARRLWPRPGPTAYGPASAAERAALGRLIGLSLIHI